MTNTKQLLTALTLALPMLVTAQENYKEITNLKDYKGKDQYTVTDYSNLTFSGKPQNVILFIGDGMGVSHVFAGITANGGTLNLCNFKNIGFSKTQSSDNYVTDSAAGGTALACGTKTYNGAIGVDADTIAVKSILELSEERGKSTGLVATATIVHATPAAFIAHVKNRSQYEDIAQSFVDTDIDFFMGGGKHFFTDRKDGRNLYNELKNKGYKIFDSLDDAKNCNDSKMGIVTDWEHPDRAVNRKYSLADATDKAIDVLKTNKKGFFLMVEGSQIDWGGHQNDTKLLVGEMLDMDKAIGKALEFAAKDKHTLIVITADHETGGYANIYGNMKTGDINGGYCTGNHTATMVPVFAFGPGAELFRGIYENVEVFNKMAELSKVKK